MVTPKKQVYYHPSETQKGDEMGKSYMFALPDAHEYSFLQVLFRM